MRVKEMIQQLNKLYRELGDVEVLITDGHDCLGYRGTDEADFEIVKWEEDGVTYVDIGIGGCRE